ncbi:Na+ H+ antiporter [Fusarium heterosporum]|uniref:Na+ H+ antiporter n=1 Tax=Fusarium heterosporum TaxID=42747 RepID=A0A8H5WVB6_FUSHE|nr:Na+ H+ antiporter [Fusarium heterosporum]
MASAPSGAAVLAVNYSLITIAALIIAARVYLRLVIQRERLIVADWLRIAAWCSAFIMASFDIVFMQEGALKASNNYTLENWDVPPEKLEKVLKHIWAAVLPFFTTFYLCKASLLVVYLQLFPSFMKKRRGVLWASIVYCAAAFIISTCLQLFLCFPIERNWSVMDPEKLCGNAELAAVFQVAWSLHFVGSLILLYKLNMRTRVKISVYSIFLLGLIDIAISLTRFLTIQLSAVGNFRSMTTIGMLKPPHGKLLLTGYYLELWSGLDAYIGLIIACLPALRPYLHRRGTKYDYSESARPTAHSNIPPRQGGQNGFEEIDETPSLEGDSGPGVWDGSSLPDAHAEWSDKKNKLAYCGLIGQIALGIAWGTPGAKWLSDEVENAVVQFGYLGLILLVYEGGLSTSFESLKANLWLSSVVATTGILLPIGFSFAVMSMLNATPLQAFSAGAALCSTSLGTTFTILGTSGLSSTRLGVVLTSAAMMDDVIGLIMVQVISNLGGDAFDAITVVRPILVSLAFAIIVPILCRFIVVPVTTRLNSIREANPASNNSKILSQRQTALIIHTTYLFGIVVGAIFAGTSGLLAAYIAGATVSWWDSDVPHLKNQVTSVNDNRTSGGITVLEDQLTMESPPVPIKQATSCMAMEGGSGAEIFHRYYEPTLKRILKPFFFASIGFSVPITKLFSSPIVWRGVVYTILMLIAKLACGLWLVTFTNPYRALAQRVQKISPKLRKSSKTLVPGAQCADNPSTTSRNEDNGVQQPQEGDISLEPISDTNDTQVSPQVRNSTPKPEKSLSLYPACIVGIGMVARGEIGYLISALAESKGIFGGSADGQPSELFLIVTWAITLCTVIGPISVGLIVNRVRVLESGSQKAKSESKRNVLGAWGVS